MAYLRNETEKLEVDYPLESLWKAIPDAIKFLEWKIQEKNEKEHKVIIKSKGGFLAYSTRLNIELTPVDEKTTRISIEAETPVTTITSVLDFGRTQLRIGQFIEALAKLMEKKENVDAKSAKI